MKQVTTVLAILIASLTTTQAQVSVNMPVGYSSLQAPTIGVSLQGNIRHFIVSGGFDNHISRDKMKGNLVWFRAGGSILINGWNTLEITAGAAQHRRSSDTKSLNEGLAVVNVRYVHQMESRPEAALFASITGTQKFAIFSGGLRFTFLRRGYCPANRKM